MALALRVLLIHARNRFSSSFFSVSEGCRSIGRACWQLLGKSIYYSFLADHIIKKDPKTMN